MNIYQSLVKHFGNQEKTAAALLVDQGTVSGWVRGRYGMGPIPALRAEQITGGKFKAVELCKRLEKLAKPCVGSEAKSSCLV